MSGAILLTGATGFLGMDTLARLIDRGEDQVIVIVRADDSQRPQQRLAATLARLYEDPGPAAARVCAVEGDLLEPELGISREDRDRLVDGVDRIIHCAASISFDSPLEQARAINVEGVARVVELAREIAAGGRLRRLVHVSTAYVSGRHCGRFDEHDLDVGQKFRNTYERSKHEAEHLLREAGDLPTVVARPSIVVGDRASGWTPAFNVIYWPIRAAERGLLRELPARPDSIVDFVPVDYVTDGLLALLDDADAEGTYHLVAGEHALSAGEMAELHSSLLGRAPVRLVAGDAVGELPQGAEAYIPYFDVRCAFDDARMRPVLQRIGLETPRPSDYLGQLIAYAHRTRWGKRPLSRQAAMDLMPS
ncbi:MAG TPA: SDR family oxidoreductase [Solirubrobacteraceae bacterium]|jgi:thioester reductase-like protein|nr:SDR family oxidoreductase [Solirubrobacteraceae bacterium]